MLRSPFARAALASALAVAPAHARTRLAATYASTESASDKRKVKLAMFAELQRSYDLARLRDPGLGGYAQWFSQHVGNAKLAAVGVYADRVPAFRAMLQEERGDLPRFYARVRELGNRRKCQRERIVDRYQALETPPTDALHQATAGPAMAVVATAEQVHEAAMQRPGEVRP